MATYDLHATINEVPAVTMVPAKQDFDDMKLILDSSKANNREVLESR